MAIDIKRILAKREQLKTNKNTENNPTLWKPTANHVVRLLPLQSEASFPFQELYFYYSFGGANFLSPISYGETDPILEFGDSLIKAGDGKLSKEEYKTIKKKFSPQKRTFAPILVRGEEKFGCRFWGFGKTIFDQILAALEETDLTDIHTGQDLKLEFLTKEQTKKDFTGVSMNISVKQSVLTTDADLLETLLHKQPILLDELKNMRKTKEELNALLDKVVDIESNSPSTSTDAAPVDDSTWANDNDAAPSVNTPDDVAAEFKQLFDK
jgi:hypothetical protein